MKKTYTLPILFSIVLTFFLLYGLAFANEKKPTVKAVHPSALNVKNKPMQHNIGSNPETKKTPPNIKSEKINLQFFQNHLKKDMTQADVIKVFGDNYRESLTDQSGEPAWTYDFPKDPTYQTKVPPYAVDENGILAGKMLYQLTIVWNEERIKSYIVFYNNNGNIGELKEKFFEGTYSNE